MAPRRKKPRETKNYRHEEATSPMRPEVGTQASFKKKKPPTTYRYDSSLAPEMTWDEGSAREEGEALIRRIIETESLEEAREAAEKLKAMSSPFLNWAGKAERADFTIPTLPLFIHERLSTKAIIETLKGHKKDKQLDMVDLFADPQHSIHDQILRAYEHQDKWVNRMILGDSLTVMNSLLCYESLGGQVQMIYMDPPYGVKFGSNFQPFVRRRDVKNNDDDHFSREPEMVKAYRDTWELGLHSYLAYMRDRLLLCRELLHPSGSIFVQISDENVHHVRELMDEVLGYENFVCCIVFRKKLMPLGAKTLETMHDNLLWYAKDTTVLKYKHLFLATKPDPSSRWTGVELANGKRRPLTKEERHNLDLLPEGSRVYSTVSQWAPSFSEANVYKFKFQGRVFYPSKGQCWVTAIEKMELLATSNRLEVEGDSPRYVMYHNDFPFKKITNPWYDTAPAQGKQYVVQTNPGVVQRCMLMTTDPGDLVIDPTCGGGTTAYVAEQWGRRWITVDVSRVPLALGRQRLLTATFPWYELRDEGRGPASGFVYERKQNKKGEEVGGIVPHITLKAIANDEPPAEEIL
ncbi:site-specific DNA-methyltransferase, partial [bacterium]|nr:site-specific DNA-methyltransferase [bacterium]